MIKIFGKPQCPYCVQAKSLCEREGLPYEYFQLGEDFTREELLEDFPNARTFPQITDGTEYVGGFDQLKARVDLRKMDDLL